MKEAMFYERLDEKKVRCFLCAHHCVIKEGKRGICSVRENRDGTLYSLVYGKLISMNIDPIEKKPLFHFLPGSTSFSIATVGCNFRCEHCQNNEISQYPKEHGGDIIGQLVNSGSRLLKRRSKTAARVFPIPIPSRPYILNSLMTAQNLLIKKGSGTSS